jgi:hypothetical protein
MSPLRRADWRFLLPLPEGTRYGRLALLGGGEDLPGRLDGLAGRITAEVDGVNDADVVVVMADCVLPLEQIVARVQSRAALYIEVDRRRPGRRGLTPARLRKMLDARGLTPVAWHWVIPDFEHARRHIPLDAPAALGWYLTTLQTAGSPAARLADAGVRLLARAGAGHLAAWVPCYSVTALGSARAPGPVGVLAPAAGPVAMLTSGQDDGSRVVLLPFEAGASAPARVLKVARMASFEAHTEREQGTLAQLRSGLPPSLRSSLPEPLGVRRWNGLLVATESYAPGAPLVVSSGRYGTRFRRVGEDLRRTVDWLIEFHLATRIDGAGWSAELAERTSRRLASGRPLFADGSPVHALLDSAGHAARRLAGAPLPIVPLHNDLGPWNIHRDGDRITVIDWELGDGSGTERIGPAACDLFYFLTYWCFRVRHLRSPRAELRGLRELFVTPERGGEASRAAHAEIQRYTARLAIDPAFLPLLLVSTWVDRTLDRVERAKVAGVDGAATADNQYARYLEVLAERADPWFQERRWP